MSSNNNSKGSLSQTDDNDRVLCPKNNYGTSASSSPPDASDEPMIMSSSNHLKQDDKTPMAPPHPLQVPQIQIRPRVLYSSMFVWFSLTGGRFISLQLQQEGHLTDSQIGICFALQTILGSSCVIWAGSLADHMERKLPKVGRSVVITIGVVIASIAFWLQPLQQSILSSFFSHDATASLGDISTTSSSNSTVYWYVAMRCIYAMAFTCTLPILDGLTLDYLATHDGAGGKEDYGKERLYGAITWAITHLMIGPSLDYFGFRILYPYSVVATLVVLVTLFLFTKAAQQQQQQNHQYGFENMVNPKEEGNDNNQHGSEKQDENEDMNEGLALLQNPNQNESDANDNVPFRKILRLICCGSASNGHVMYFGIAFMIAIFCLSIGTSVVESLVFLYFEALGSSYTLCSFTVILTVMFEIPIFHVGPTMLKRYGTTNLFLVACFCYMTRVIGYSLVPSGRPWWVLFMEPLHGVTYACASISSVQFVAESLMPYQGYDATGQGILSALKGCGNVIGLLFGGIGEDVLGPRTMYRSLAAVVTLGFTLLYLASRQQQQQQQGRNSTSPKPSPVSNEDEESYQQQFIS